MKLKFREKAADWVAKVVGSWTFIITQSFILVAWMFLNTTNYIKHWDNFPYILLNLALSFQAAFTAPIIMMSQNRQATLDRKKVQGDRHVLHDDLDITKKTAGEILLLHEKIDLLKEKEIKQLIDIIKEISEKK